MSLSQPEIVNTVTSARQGIPTITALDSGGWVVAWESNTETPPGSSYGVYLQTYAADGSKVGGETMVPASSAGQQKNADITTLEGGGFVVTWSDDLGLAFQAFDANGGKVGEEGSIVPAANQNLWLPSVVARDNGAFSIVYTNSYFTGGNGWKVEIENFDQNGVSLGEPQLVHNDSVQWHFSPMATALANGGFAVAWESDFGMLHRVYAADGTTVPGADLTVDGAEDAAGSTGMRMASLADGGYIIAWQAQPSTAIMAQRFHADGTDNGDTFEISSAVVGNTEASVTGLADGRFVVTWCSNNKVIQSVFDATGNILVEEVEVSMAGHAAERWQTDITGLADGGWVVTWMENGADGEYDVFQQRYEVDNQVYGTNDAPSGADKLITADEDVSHVFAEADFGFTDQDGNALGSVIITALGSGTLTLDGQAVAVNQEISASDLHDLEWTLGTNKFGSATGFTFKLADDGGTEGGGVDMTAENYEMSFEVADVVDRFTGRRKADNLKGTEGVDILNGKAGNDKLTGRDGADMFVFRKGYDRDTINDFEAGGDVQDVIDVSRFKGIDTIRDLKPLMEAHGSQVWIDFGHGDELIIRGVTIKELGRADFIF